jgi:putative two-component system response regulator
MTEILVVDDEEALRRSLERQLRGWGYRCEGVGNASAARAALEAAARHLVLLDSNLPGESGIELLNHIRRSYPEVAVVMVTGEDDPKLARAAIASGAYGYLVKPIRATELLINIANALHRRALEARNRRAMERLQATVEQRSTELLGALGSFAQSTSMAIAAQTETIARLARLIEARDEGTGRHLDRMSHLCGLIGHQMGLAREQCDTLELASQLHDVGKVAISDAILLKPGKLTTEEFEVMKGHAEAGYRMLSDSRAELIQLAALIARTHHERYEGTGYPQGLAGADIPIEGRIAAVADVYDALTSDRVYRPAFAPRTAVDMMDAERGTHFDPDVLDAFHAAVAALEEERMGNTV